MTLHVRVDAAWMDHALDTDRVVSFTDSDVARVAAHWVVDPHRQAVRREGFENRALPAGPWRPVGSSRPNRRLVGMAHIFEQKPFPEFVWVERKQHGEINSCPGHHHVEEVGIFNESHGPSVLGADSERHNHVVAFIALKPVHRGNPQIESIKILSAEPPLRFLGNRISLSSKWRYRADLVGASAFRLAE